MIGAKHCLVIAALVLSILLHATSCTEGDVYNIYNTYIGGQHGNPARMNVESQPDNEGTLQRISTALSSIAMGTCFHLARTSQSPYLLCAILIMLIFAWGGLNGCFSWAVGRKGGFFAAVNNVVRTGLIVIWLGMVARNLFPGDLVLDSATLHGLRAMVFLGFLTVATCECYAHLSRSRLSVARFIGALSCIIHVVAYSFILSFLPKNVIVSSRDLYLSFFLSLTASVITFSLDVQQMRERRIFNPGGSLHRWAFFIIFGFFVLALAGLFSGKFS